MHGVFVNHMGLELRFWSGSHGLELHAAAMTLSNECPMCEANVLQGHVRVRKRRRLRLFSHVPMPSAPYLTWNVRLAEAHQT